MVCKNDELKLQDPMPSTMKMSLMILYTLLIVASLQTSLILFLVFFNIPLLSLRTAVFRLFSAQHSRLLHPVCLSVVTLGLFLLHFLGELQSQLVGECWWPVSSGGQILHLKGKMSVVGI